MNDDIISLSDETYYKGASVILGEPEYVKVIVENSFDVPFWQDFLTTVLPEKDFDISPFSYSNDDADLTMGKAHIYKKAENSLLGPHYLGCVDADYDFLLAKHTHDGITLDGSKYLIHTLAYAVENLLCCPSGLAQVCTQASKHQVNLPFEGWMKDVSKALYPLLVWSLYLDSRDDEHKVFSVKEWAQVFPHDKSFVADDNAANDIVDEIAANVEDFIKKIEGQVTEEDKEAKDRLEAEMREQKGLTPEDSFLYVRGHDLYAFVRDTMVKPASIKAKNEHLAEIDANARSEKERNNIKGQYVKQVKDAVMYLETNYAYKTGLSSVYHAIKDRCVKSQG